jgi:hypothetical protein
VGDYLYSEGRRRSDPRYCRTHAHVANLFAQAAKSESLSGVWSYIAKAWTDLAEIKERLGKE